MTRDEILAMARDAGMEVHERKGQIRIGSAVLTGADSTDEVTRFAALVAAKERESVAQLIETTEWWKAPKWQSALCPITKGAIADAIRARGRKGGV